MQKRGLPVKQGKEPGKHKQDANRISHYLMFPSTAHIVISEHEEIEIAGNLGVDMIGTLSTPLQQQTSRPLNKHLANGPRFSHCPKKLISRLPKPQTVQLRPLRGRDCVFSDQAP